MEAEQTTQAQPESDLPVYFQYVGAKGLTVLGPISHQRYRFTGPGAVVAIDVRDKHALEHVPFLRQVRKATDVAAEY